MKLLFLIALLITAENSLSQESKQTRIKVTTLEYDEENKQTDTSTFYVTRKSELTFELLNEYLYGRVQIPDSFRNSSHSSDTVVAKSNLGNKSYEITVSMLYDKNGYLIEQYYSSCLGCGNQSSRYYYEYNDNKIDKMIHDNLGNSTRQIYEVVYDSENAISKIIIYKEYYPKSFNIFSNIFGKPIYTDDLEYSKQKVDRRISLLYE